ncbi:hypothetical protein AQJ43_31490 [Streptomyces avermitilis]|uniref:Uncharacterized protein n=1 Tax=Streptomyces avermitilis TaxID=33903 RepID=A0A4D4N6W1_STRAX|nr:hypothetical protein AQJ43_31490 [Streptomyces avermitilis]OOV16708.1 hypothetical protein SM007_38120 [Streptomyces avermitilis]BBJ48167.1 hypothetical protein SAVMC3_07960 [Streptomyces avermitilis]GDY79714.1 hypothetical protein SAV31267_091990 [Streptomyces avermitilis]
MIFRWYGPVVPRLVEVPGDVRFWTTSAVSAFGSQVTGLALQILTAVALSASIGRLPLVLGPALPTNSIPRQLT